MVADGSLNWACATLRNLLRRIEVLECNLTFGILLGGAFGGILGELLGWDLGGVLGGISGLNPTSKTLE